ncbi:MAG: phage tail protein [Oscillochloris sp.]|nr:phage tail protein [Oscillochloris sp.]
MASDKATIKQTYPLPLYNYRVTVGAETIGFAEVSGLSLAYEEVIYKHGLSFVMGAKIIPGMRQPIKLTMKRGIIKGKDLLSRWVRDAYADPFKTATQDILVDLCDETGAPVVRWKVLGALPTKIDAPTFDANSNEVAVETIELVAHGLQIEYL